MTKSPEASTTVAEFSRQADAMAEAPAFLAADILSLISDAIGPAPVGLALDLACGPGIVARTIAAFASQVIGVDATPRMVQLAEERCRGLANCSFYVASAEDLPFAAGDFDVVVTRLSFHHFVDPRAVLAGVRRVLRVGGRLVATDIVSSPDPDEARLHNALEQLRDPAHVRMLTGPELSTAIVASGFEVLDEDMWKQPRTFSEWSAVVAEPSRTEPLRIVMQALARAGCHVGLELEEGESGEVRFAHTWKLVVARREA